MSRVLKTVGVAAVLALLALGLQSWLSGRGPASQMTSADVARLADELGRLEEREQRIAETVWGPELVAQDAGRVFQELWDALNATGDKLGLLAAVPFGRLQPRQWETDTAVGHQITVYRPTSAAPEWGPPEWANWLNEIRSAGWELGAVEFRHNRCDVEPNGGPSGSVFYCSAQLINSVAEARATVQGDLEVAWGGAPFPGGLPTLQHLDARGLTITVRPGPPVFEEILHEPIAPPEKSFFIDPLILQDLDGDGLSEIILAASNTLFRRLPDGSLLRTTLCRQSPGLIFTAVIADFDQDGRGDFLSARHDGLYLIQGSADGGFEGAARKVWGAEPRLKYGQALTCGDVDGDGDLDVWLGQYKLPYQRGQMPTPYYDANDGYPAWLLLNTGQGEFRDATLGSGLAPKRFRRSYSGSLADLDRDGDLDLLVVSDFAGVDLHLNDGRGHFTDVTDSWIPEPHGFGMGHTFADFNRDGLLDFLVTGMHCPTALRLDHFGLNRAGREDYGVFRKVMTAGNRLWIARADRGFERTAMNASIAVSGWSWGGAKFDCDNDGWPDVFIPNGHETRQSVRDYEPEFWLHDIYVGDSGEDLLRTAYFGAKMARTLGRGWSYGGYEMNRLYLNRRGTAFTEVGHLFGVGHQLDCRTAVTDDLDGDGWMDLLVTSFEIWPEPRQTLRVFRNTSATHRNWIGFRFREGRASPIGATVRLRSAEGEAVEQIVVGDSHRAQRGYTVHFGLGDIERVVEADVTWPYGPVLQLASPQINRYHEVTAPP